jgi:hypothetical protein
MPDTLANRFTQKGINSQHKGSGFVLFSRTEQMVFMNRVAKVLLRRLQSLTTTQEKSHFISEEIRTIVD